MVALRGSASKVTTANGTSLTASKPSGVIAGDVLLASFTNNHQTVTRPSGWVVLYNLVASTGNSFSSTLCYKVAGASEPSSYTFSVPSAAPLVLVLTAWSGVDNSNPIGSQYSTNNPGAASEPVTGPFLDATISLGHLVHFRSVRFPGTTVPTFSTSASGVAELADTGVFSGGAVCYAMAVHHQTADFSGAGHYSGLATTCTQSESDNLLSIVALKANTPPTLGALSASLPRPVAMASDGTVHDDATVSATLPHPMVTSWAGIGQPVAATGTFSATLGKVSASAVGASAAVGSFAVTVLPKVSFGVETRVFGIRVIPVEADNSRRIIVQSRGLAD